MARLHVAAGTQLHPWAAAWLMAAAERTGAAGVFCDYEERDAAGTLHPAFQPMFDPVWMTEADMHPPAMLRRGSLTTGEMPGRVAHLPLLLAMRPLPERSLAVPAVARAAGDAVIQVVIQTRDEAEALQVSVDSLVETAHRPELLDVVIVDNRSTEAETMALLGRWRRERRARALPLDEPFNWARANNLAAATGSAPLLLFLNNDTEMLLDGWDSVMRRELDRAGAGILGALLLYPDRTIQHGGVIFGMSDGGPVHEGVGTAPATIAFQARWTRSRSAAAVTGAWMALRRDDFLALGGFNERLAIAFNDIDLCLRSRARGWSVVVRADVIAVHHESLTRGLRLDAAAQAREQAEYAILKDTWGGLLREDPSYNPHWARAVRPFDGLRYPTAAETIDWLDRSARHHPWCVAVEKALKAVE